MKDEGERMMADDDARGEASPITAGELRDGSPQCDRIPLYRGPTSGSSPAHCDSLGFRQATRRKTARRLRAGVPPNHARQLARLSHNPPSTASGATPARRPGPYQRTAESRLATHVLVAMLTVLLFAAPSLAEDRQHVLVVVGADGTTEYSRVFRIWADRWQSAAAAGEAHYVAIGVGSGTDDLQQLSDQLSEWALMKTTEPLWLVLIGHGTFDGRAARFNLDGPDLSAEHLGEMLAAANRPIAVIDCSSSSSPFINSISGSHRVVVTATKDGNEMQFSRFGDFLSEAIVGLDADMDRDGQSSLLEAWLFASRRTAEFYESEGRLATEHSLLDDTGDAQGSRAELFEGVRVKRDVKEQDKVDGQLAHRWHLVRSAEERVLTAEERDLRDELEQQLAALREQKDQIDEDTYLNNLETVLLPLARLYDEVARRYPTDPTGAATSVRDSVHSDD